MTKKNKNWFRKHWIWSTLIGLILFSIVLSAIMPHTEAESNANQVNTYSDINDDIEYLEFIIKYNKVMTDTIKIVEDISYMTANGEIRMYQAGVLYKSAGDTFEVALETLDSVDVPVKFIEYHKHMRKSVVYMIDAMYLVSEGTHTENVNLINRGAEKIKLATYETETATFILEELS